MAKALFLDRDGVINIDINYLHKPEDCVFTEGIFELCQAAITQGYQLIVVTNQAGIARGFYTEATYQHFTQWLKTEFENHGCPLTAVYHCPHHPQFTGPCTCRKPQPGMLLQAAHNHSINLTQSVMVGDSPTDLQAALAANIPTRIFFNTTPPPPEATHHITFLSEIHPLLLSSFHK